MARASIRSLSEAELMQEYGDPGHLLNLTLYAVLNRRTPFPLGDQTSYALKYLLFCDIKAEILRRGAPMAPLLSDFLNHLFPGDRLAPTPPTSGMGFWYDSEMITLLAQIRTQSSAQELLFLLADDGKTKKGRREEAQFALESLTYC